VDLAEERDGRPEVEADGSDLQAFAAMLVRRRWLIVMCVAIGVVVGGVYSLLQPKVYQATALIRVQTPPGTQGDVNAQINASTQLAKSYALIFDDRTVMTIAASKIGHGTTPGQLLQHVNSAVLQDTDLIRLTSTGSSPEAARDLAERVAEFGVSYLVSQGQARNQSAVASLNEQIDTLNSEASDLVAQKVDAQGRGQAAKVSALDDQIQVISQRRQALATEVASLITEGEQQTSTITLIAPATGSSAPISPRPVFNVVMGLFFGLVIGIVLAWLRDQLDRTVREVSEVERLSHRPLLGLVPLVRGGLTNEQQMENVFTVVRVNLALAATEPQRGPRVLTITSARESEGKTFTALGVGRALARGGRRVVIVDCDLRRKGVTHAIEARRSGGISEVLMGELSLSDAQLEIQPGLTVVPAGGSPADPASLLDTRAFEEILASLKSEFDYVLVDTPPFNQVADAAIAGTRSDGVIAVVRLGSSVRQELAHMFDRLRNGSFTFIGTIVHSADVDLQSYTYEGESAEQAAAPGTLVRRLTRR
jgi:capsular exopolysaccharide synthesis family protein